MPNSPIRLHGVRKDVSQVHRPISTNNFLFFHNTRTLLTHTICTQELLHPGRCITFDRGKRICHLTFFPLYWVSEIAPPSFMFCRSDFERIWWTRIGSVCHVLAICDVCLTLCHVTLTPIFQAAGKPNTHCRSWLNISAEMYLYVVDKK